MGTEEDRGGEGRPLTRDDQKHSDLRPQTARRGGTLHRARTIRVISQYILSSVSKAEETCFGLLRVSCLMSRSSSVDITVVTRRDGKCCDMDRERNPKQEKLRSLFYSRARAAALRRAR